LPLGCVPVCALVTLPDHRCPSRSGQLVFLLLGIVVLLNKQ
jgi:hypothetical protein